MPLTRDAGTLAGIALTLLVTLSACPNAEREHAPAAPASPQEQAKRDALYALGSWLARNLAGMRFDESDLEPLEQGLADALLGRPLRVDPKDVGTTVQRFLNTRRAEVSASERREAEPFLAAARARPGAASSSSGLIFESLVEGDGATPSGRARVRLDYEGRLRDGSVFDASREHGQPGIFTLTKVIPCWSEALERMKVGGKARVTCPSDLAYGDRGIGGKILPGAPLEFELELLEVLPPEAAAR